jgi:hypothetical protein
VDESPKEEREARQKKKTYQKKKKKKNEGFRSIVNQKISYGCKQESHDLIQEM